MCRDRASIDSGAAAELLKDSPLLSSSTPDYPWVVAKGLPTIRPAVGVSSCRAMHPEVMPRISVPSAPKHFRRR